MINANSNFLDICVVEWCKLFGDLRGKHHWKKVISDAESFNQGMLNHIRLNETAFDTYIQKMRSYRDKFIAHLDSEPVMEIPDLEIAFLTVSYLYDNLLVQERNSTLFADAPKSASIFYAQYFNVGKKAYLT